MSELLYFLVIGTGVGAVYALTGLGVVTMFKGAGLANFAQGNLMVLGALVSVTVMSAVHSYLVAMLAAVVVVGSVGVFLGLLFCVPMRRRQFDIDVVVIGTLGVATTMLHVTSSIFGRQAERVSGPVEGKFLEFGELRVPAHYLLLAIVAVLMFLAVHAFHKYTDTGLQLRAVASSVPGARDAGVRVERMLVISWTMAAVIGAVAGVLVGSVLPISPEAATSLGINGFAAAIIGGLANPAGAVIGGLVIGVSESLAGGYLNDAVRQAIAPLVLLGVLILRPQGLLASRTKVRTA